MGRCAKSKTKERRDNIEISDKWKAYAAEKYKEEQEKGSSEGKKGLRKICQETEEECWKEDKMRIKLSKTSLSRYANGGKTQAQSNAEKSLITDKEADVIIEYAVELANQGHGLSRKRLEEHANEILQGRQGNNFKGVGHNWASRFLEKHSTRLQTYWSHPLDHSRARAANPHTKKAFFDLYEKTVQGKDGKEPIPDELKYGADETGIQQGIGTRQRIIGPKGKKIQHQQRSGDRENITVIVTICADGTSLPPAVIYRGESFQTSWKQDNPLNASLGHSKKGYTDGEIGVEWIKQFDRQTRAKAAGRQRLLLVDGHNSHYTRAFLEHARTHHIHVLCYPSHSTHIYQGLDVVIFSVLKRRWTECRDEYEQNHGHKVDKTNFLSVYAKAHMQALSKANILAAFRKTGIVPLNRNIITAEMLAPSTSSSCQGFLPIPQASPVRVMEDMIHRHLARDMARRHGDTETLPTPGTSQLHISTPVRVALDELAYTSASYLVSNSPPRSAIKPPRFMPYTISPINSRRVSQCDTLQDDRLLTERESLLLQALQMAEERDEARKRVMIGMQATSVLQGMYVAKVQGHLQEHEVRAGKKKTKNRLFGDGYGKLMDADAFFQATVQIEQNARKKEEEKVEKARKREDYATVIAQWKSNEVARKARNEEVRKAYQDATKAWEVEHDLAKEEKRKPQWTKPKKGRMEKPIPRPKKSEGDEDDSENGDENDDDVYGAMDTDS